MDPQLSAALLALALLIIGSVGAVVKALTDRVLRDLEQNTQLTREARKAANGQLREALDRLAAERNRVVALRELVRERDDRLAYLEARLPDVPGVLQGYQERRQARYSATQELAAERHILNSIDDLDDPTGTDAGAHRHSA